MRSSYAPPLPGSPGILRLSAALRRESKGNQSGTGARPLPHGEGGGKGKAFRRAWLRASASGREAADLGVPVQTADAAGIKSGTRSTPPVSNPAFAALRRRSPAQRVPVVRRRPGSNPRLENRPAADHRKPGTVAAALYAPVARPGAHWAAWIEANQARANWADCKKKGGGCPPSGFIWAICGCSDSVVCVW